MAESGTWFEASDCVVALVDGVEVVSVDEMDMLVGSVTELVDDDDDQEPVCTADECLPLSSMVCLLVGRVTVSNVWMVLSFGRIAGSMEDGRAVSILVIVMSLDNIAGSKDG